MKLTELVILIKGGGEVASAVAHRLHNAHFKVFLTETPNPLAVSRGVSFSEAIYNDEKEVEGVTAKLVKSAGEITEVWEEKKLPIIVDPETAIKDTLHTDIVIDAIMAKRNLGTKLTDASLVIGLGPGFYAGKDVHMVVETNNSESLGRVIFEGEAEKNTGIPVTIGGLTSERVIHAPDDGLFLARVDIGDTVTAGEVIASLGDKMIKAPISGLVRALLRSGIPVKKEVKLAEIDQMGSREQCFSIRDRMRSIAGGVLEAILVRFNV